jgi:hypothetical protein
VANWAMLCPGDGVAIWVDHLGPSFLYLGPLFSFFQPLFLPPVSVNKEDARCLIRRLRSTEQNVTSYKSQRYKYP